MATKDEIQQLISAVLSSDLEAVERLLKQTDDLIKLQNENGKTLLHLAAQVGNADIVTALLRANTNAADPIPDFINVKDAEGNTALHIAAKNNHLAVAEVLVSYSNEIKLDIRNNNSKLAVDLLPTDKDFYNFAFLLTNPGGYFNSNEEDIKRNRLKTGLKIDLMVVGGILAAGVTSVGMAALALTLLGISFLPVASLTMLIAAAVVAAVGIIGLGVTIASTIRFYRNRTVDDSPIKTPVADPTNSITTATQSLGGKEEKPKGATHESLPAVHPSPLNSAGSATSPAPTSTPAPGAGLTKQS